VDITSSVMYVSINGPILDCWGYYQVPGRTLP
jgi:hypothetical protein